MGITAEQQPLYPQASLRVHHPCHLHPHRCQEREKGRCRKFLKFFLLIGLIYVVYRHVAPDWRMFWRTHHPHHHDDPWDEAFPRDSPIERRHFSWPLDTTGLSFLTHHGDVYGTLRIESTEDKLDKLQVDLAIHYRHPEAQDWLDVTAIKQGDGTRGLEIYTHIPPERRRGHDTAIRVDIRVTIPEGSNALKRLRTEMSVFHQTIDDLPGIVLDTAEIKTVSGSIMAKNLAGKTARVDSVNGRIGGTFNVTDSLQLETANGAIDVVVFLLNAEERKPTKAFMKTSNGSINSKLNLVSTQSDDSKGGVYEVEATTSNGAVHVSFDDAPLKSQVRAKVETVMGHGSLFVHPTYEGKFDMSNTMGSVNFVNSEPSDPAGQGRNRKVHFNKRGNHVTGDVAWEEGRADVGEVSLRSTMGGLTLIL